MVETIYILLLDEGVDVWRPVRAYRVSEEAYNIPSATVIPAGEVWQFQPGDTVRTRMQVSEGLEIRAAYELVKK